MNDFFISRRKQLKEQREAVKASKTTISYNQEQFLIKFRQANSTVVSARESIGDGKWMEYYRCKEKELNGEQ